jgi:hypothetical protein
MRERKRKIKENNFKINIIKMAASSESDKRNIMIAVGVIVVLVIGWMLLSPKKKRYNNKQKDRKDIKDDKRVMESFTDETHRENDESVFSLFNFGDSSNDVEENFETVENFPQTTAMNVLYSDPSGNLGSTSDLGLQNLTVKGESQVGGNLILSGDNQWIVHTPDDGRKTMYFAPFKDDKSDWNWAKNISFSNGGDITATGSVSAAGSVNASGNVNASGSVTTNRGYAMVNNRNVKPNQLAGGNLQFGFGSMDNNSGSPYADTIHFNGWGDASGGNPNLVMFNKTTPGMRIYHGSYNSDNAFNTYKDAVMSDSKGNVEIGGSVKIGSWTISEDNTGHLVFSKDGAGWNSNAGTDKGHIRMTQDGNIWQSRSTGWGWTADNIGAIRGDIAGINNNLNNYVKYADNLNIYSSSGTRAGGALGVCGWCGDGVGAVFGRPGDSGDSKITVNFRKP